MEWPMLYADALAVKLGTQRVGRAVRVFPETRSTNDEAFSAAVAAGPSCDGLAIFAEHQYGGRGRQGRTWEAPRASSILCSVVLFEPDEVERAEALTLIGGIATCDAIRETTTVWPSLRWPNDVRVEQKKLAGVLLESRPVASGHRVWVMGIGINCYQQRSHFPVELVDIATSLEIESREPVDRLYLARELLCRLDAWVAPPWPSDDDIRQAWLERAESLGQHVTIRSEGRTFTGRTIDVHPHEGLLVQLDDGGRRWFEAATSQII